MFGENTWYRLRARAGVTLARMVKRYAVLGFNVGMTMHHAANRKRETQQNDWAAKHAQTVKLNLIYGYLPAKTPAP